MMPLALLAVAGVAAGVAGVKAAQHAQRRRRDNRSKQTTASASAAPPGWYEAASGLRYWDGTAWTNDFAQRQPAAVRTPANWYVDPANATQLRYWNGVAWTAYVAPRRPAATTPANWYPDPWDATQVRYWDGTAWSSHVTSRHRSTAVPRPADAPSTQDNGAVPARGQDKFRMSTAEWQAHVRAWMTAGAIEQELWSRLSNVHIEDADETTLAAQREMEQLTPQQAAHRIRLVLEANPSLRDDRALTDRLILLGVGRKVPVHGDGVGAAQLRPSDQQR